MTIAIENASSELVDIFAEIHNLLSSHCCREKMDVVGRMNLIHKKSANKEGPRPKCKLQGGMVLLTRGVFCVYFDDGVHFSQKEESQQVGRQRVHT